MDSPAGQGAESESLLRASFDHAPTAMSLTRWADARYLRVNDRYCELLGLPREKIVGATGFTLGLWEDVAGREAFLVRIRRDARAQDIVITPTLRGERRHLLASAHEIMHEGERCVLSSVVDITDLKRSAEAARVSEERFRRAFTDARTGMALFDRGGNYLQVNRALCDMLGYDEAELLKIGFRGVTHPEDLEMTVAKGRTHVADKQAPLSFEKRYLRKDGAIVWARVTSSPITDERGELAYFVSHIEDITASRELDEAARKERVSRRVVRGLLRGLAEQGSASAQTRRQLGRTLALETEASDLSVYLASFAALGVGELQLAAQQSDRYEFRGSGLLEMTPGAGSTTCHVALGYVEAAIERTSGHAALGAEVECESQGKPRCRFIVRAR